MSKEQFDRAMTDLQGAMAEGVNIQLDIIRRRALYPDLASMDKRTNEIIREHAVVPVNQADKDVEHLLHHISMLRRALKAAQK